MDDEIILPEALLNDTAAEEEATPTLAPRKTPKLGPNSTPGSIRPLSIGPSPQLGAMASPTESAKRPVSKGASAARGSKRNSLSSSHASPALRPKISPSIKPLIRGNGSSGKLSPYHQPPNFRTDSYPDSLSADASALLLASKSNYQNILEGTHFPGVSYPDNLAENLSSKRTSHKIAEQGRRNRINVALKEIEGLLPPSMMSPKPGSKEGSASGGDGGGGSGGGTTKSEKEKEKAERASAAAQNSSKASTVEMAIDYIKSLQRELSETKGRLEVAEKRLAEKGDDGDGDGNDVGVIVAATSDGDAASTPADD